MRDHQQGDVDDGDDVGGTQLACHKRQAEPHGVVVGDEKVAGAHNVERDYKEPEQWTYRRREKSHDGQQAGGEIAIGCGRGKASGQVWADYTGKDEDQPEEAKGVNRSDDTVRAEAAHRSEPGHNPGAEAEQAGDITQNELRLENPLLSHFASFRGLRPSGTGPTSK